ncbi:MAG TPA: hypothetical protein VM165_19705 [Planctomycetaceae bacterium]|nr:hypothetical protein [Planctomycetaceae bacterium]
MMADKSTSVRRGMSPKQWALIGVLIAVLAGVLVSGRTGPESPATDGQEPSAANPARPSSRANRHAASAEAKTSATAWPEISLETALSHNPFRETAPLQAAISEEEQNAPPESETPLTANGPSPAVEMKEEDLGNAVAASTADPQSLRVSMILRNGPKLCAVIGERLVREGDVIEGLRIVSISTAGVVVERASDAPSPASRGK